MARLAFRDNTEILQRIFLGRKEQPIYKFLVNALNFTSHVHCARIRTYNQHMEHTSYRLEHTKPLLNEYKILNLENLYVYHMFMQLFKIINYRIPCSLNLCPRNQKFLLMTPKVKLEVNLKKCI